MQSSWIDLDKVLGLLKKKPTAGEKNIVINKGSIVFGKHCFIHDDADLLLISSLIPFLVDNVRFSYDQRHAALKGVSFSIQASTKVALVGQRGAG